MIVRESGVGEGDSAVFPGVDDAEPAFGEGLADTEAEEAGLEGADSAKSPRYCAKATRAKRNTARGLILIDELRIT